MYKYQKYIRKKFAFTKQEYHGQNNLERYPTPVVGAFQFVTKRYIWQVGTEKSTNLALCNY